MKKFNLLKEIIVVTKNDFLQAINSAKKFAISYEGKIVYEPFSMELISIYEGSIPPLSPLATNRSRPISTMLGTNYHVVEDDDRILIKASSAWQTIIHANQKRSLYDDTTGDGIAEFSDKYLEDLGWHATEFSISYREIVEEFETHCEGILLCIEHESPYQFSGLGFVFDIDHARKIGFEYCVNTIKDKLENDEDFATLTKDEEEAKAFFGL
jgi:peptide methionine sulfoxide reductase MsrB